MKLVHDEKGAIAIEFAIVLVFILIPLFIGLVDTARLVNAQVVLDRAAREGAVCIMRGDPYHEPIRNVLRAANFDVGGLEILPPTGGELRLRYTIPNFPLFDRFTRWAFPDHLTSVAMYQIP